MPRRRTAFTLIELTVVIGIIALLTGLLVMGVGKMSRTMKAKATAADLENVQSLFDEMNAHAGMNTTPVNWLWRNITYTAPGAPTVSASAATPPAPAVDFWRVPELVYFTAGVPTKDALEAQGSIADTDGQGVEILRNGSQAVLNTQLAMRILLSYPGNKAAIAKLPADRLFIPNWVSGSFTGSVGGIMSPVTGADGLSDTGTDNVSDPVTQVVYAVNNCVKFNGSTYRCIISNVATTTNEPSNTTAPVCWQLDSDPTPMVLDAWGNPLIFVPASGLINVYTGHRNIDGNFDSTSTIAMLGATPATNTTTVIGSSLIYARSLPPIQSPDNRPYFVSAGPDGDLSTGDDNIYSFSK